MFNGQNKLLVLIRLHTSIGGMSVFVGKSGPCLIALVDYRSEQIQILTV